MRNEYSVMKRRPRILLGLGNVVHQHTRECLEGIYDYAMRHADDWDMLTDPFDVYLSFDIKAISLQRSDAAIVWMDRESKESEKLVAMRKPVVNIAWPDNPLPFPSVCVDFAAVGRMAARYLHQPSISRHAYVGPNFRRSSVVMKAFAEELNKLGAERPHQLIEPLELRANSALRRFRHLRGMLRDTHKGNEGRTGVFAYSDSFGHAAIKAAMGQNLRVPKDVAVLGVDNESLLSHLSRIPLSSIVNDSHRVGFEAARQLHALLRGESVPEQTLIAPLRVEERLSTSPLAVDDPVVAKALTIMQDQALKGLRIKELMEYLPVSRRSFEQRFRTVVGTSPHEEVERLRVERAMHLLREDKQTNAQIAMTCGFSSALHLEQVIRKRTKHTPAYFRKRSWNG
jgi:LacI family transcriptional regulator